MAKGTLMEDKKKKLGKAKLALKKDTLRKLTLTELGEVAGGGTSNSGPTCGSCCSGTFFTGCCTENRD
jgi:hypothetical protein